MRDTAGGFIGPTSCSWSLIYLDRLSILLSLFVVRQSFAPKRDPLDSGD
jgi:hypothetical protein